MTWTQKMKNFEKMICIIFFEPKSQDITKSKHNALLVCCVKSKANVNGSIFVLCHQLLNVLCLDIMYVKFVRVYANKQNVSRNTIV